MIASLRGFLPCGPSSASSEALLSSLSRSLCGSRSSLFGAPCSRSSSSSSSSAISSNGPAIASTLESMRACMQHDVFETANSIAQGLSPAQRVVLAQSLKEQIKPEHLNDAYVEELFNSCSHDGTMSKGKFRDIILAHARLNDKSESAKHPSSSALQITFLASAIPFIAFGFLDNFIMLTAGEEIDHIFGVRFGLTTLASAGLGNCVADVIGVSAAKVIEQGVRKLPFIKDPRLSREQHQLPVVKLSKATGSTVGVLVGCLLGLAPLAYQGTFFRS